MHTSFEYRSSWLDRPAISAITLNWEKVLFGTILILGIVSRFYILGTRVSIFLGFTSKAMAIRMTR
jgi:hypothetical protein